MNSQRARTSKQCGLPHVRRFALSRCLFVSETERGVYNTQNPISMPGVHRARPCRSLGQGDSVGFFRCFLDISGRGLLLFRLLDAVVAPGSQILELAGDAAGPANFDLLHLFYSAQPEEQAQIVCSAIAGSADQLAHTTSAARGYGDQGANGVAIARRPDQLEADPGIAVAAVVAQQDGRAAVGHPEQVDVSIVVEIAGSQGPAHVSLLECWAVPGAHFLKAAAGVPQQKRPL